MHVVSFGPPCRSLVPGIVPFTLVVLTSCRGAAGPQSQPAHPPTQASPAAFVGSSSTEVNAPQNVPSIIDLPALPVPEGLEEDVRRSTAIGGTLYALDQAAARATDILQASFGDVNALGLAGYIPMREGEAAKGSSESFTVVFFTHESPPRVAYQIRLAEGQPPTLDQLSPPADASPALASLIRARQLVLGSLPAMPQPINPVLLPGSVLGEEGVALYLLAGTETPNVAVFGQHFRALVSADGGDVLAFKPLSNSALEMPLTPPDADAGEELTVALMVTHVLTEFPLETHVFTSLLIQTPVYVRTARGLWRIADGDIAFLGEQPTG